MQDLQLEMALAPGLNRTLNVVVFPSVTWLVPAVSNIFIVSSSTVDILVVAAAMRGVSWLTQKE